MSYFRLKPIHLILTISSLSQLLRSAFLAGVCIGIAGFGYLAEKSIVGRIGHFAG